MVAVAEEAGLKGVEQYEVWKEPVKMMYDETIDEKASSVAAHRSCVLHHPSAASCRFVSAIQSRS